MANAMTDHAAGMPNVAVGLGHAVEAGVPEMTDSIAQDLVRLFKLLSDETRLRILSALSRKRELHVRALCELLDQSQPAVSHHLGLLRGAGLIERRREGKHNFYHLVPSGFTGFLELAINSVSRNRPQLRFDDFAPGESDDR